MGGSLGSSRGAAGGAPHDSDSSVGTPRPGTEIYRTQRRDVNVRFHLEVPVLLRAVQES